MQISTMFLEDGLRKDYKDRPIADNCFYYAIGYKTANDLVFAEDDDSLIDYMIEEKATELSKQELHFLTKAELGKMFDEAFDYVIVRYDEYYDTLLKQDEQKKQDDYNNRRMKNTLIKKGIWKYV
ncbi:hypothetical protein GSH19_05040 [Lactobacillus sp. S2-2]|uniref:hypothetical protein n=1 Tax=Lactobacillus sp. S2-2 TaxID=2692917 RepID=UPI001F2EAA48|nr:hypothetical protein [Lactobacillus sp. S2-2]MCF6515517.1 hypothetical protein [Lactobacillus sp. S2-2]